MPYGTTKFGIYIPVACIKRVDLRAPPDKILPDGDAEFCLKGSAGVVDAPKCSYQRDNCGKTTIRFCINVLFVNTIFLSE
jgi:hypothetical protein